MEDKSAAKSVLLFAPHQIQQIADIVQVLHIKKINGIPQLSVESLTKAAIQKHFKKLPPVVSETILFFSNTELKAWEKESWNNLLNRSTSPTEEIHHTAMLRGFNQQFEMLLPFMSLFKWYHQKSVHKRNVQTAPCSFSNFRPQLQFEVVKHRDQLTVETTIVLNGTGFPLSSFNQSYFWLEHNNEYFLLRFKDVQILEWLQSADILPYTESPELFKEKILSVLEVDYKVNRNGHFKETPITQLPVNRIMLSEISGSFLMLTPQWLYENFLVEGVWKPTKEITQGGEVFIIHRNKEAEDAFRTSLQQLHPNFAKQSNGYFYLSFADAQKKSWFLKVYHQMLDKNIEIVGIDMLQHFRYSPHKAITEIGIK